MRGDEVALLFRFRSLSNLGVQVPNRCSHLPPFDMYIPWYLYLHRT